MVGLVVLILVHREEPQTAARSQNRREGLPLFELQAGQRTASAPRSTRRSTSSTRRSQDGQRSFIEERR